MRLGLSPKINSAFTQAIATVAVTTSAKRVLASRSNRVAVFLIGFGGNAFWWIDNSVATTRGFQTNATEQILEFNIENHPGLVAQEWWVIASGVGTNACAIEVFEVPTDDASGGESIPLQ